MNTNIDTNIACPKCNSAYAYQDRQLWICPECAHEWSAKSDALGAAEQNEAVHDEAVRDASGNFLVTGDSVALIKDLKVKGSTSSVKSGTKVKNIRILDAANTVDGHNIACKIDGIGSLYLKSEFVRKA